MTSSAAAQPTTNPAQAAVTTAFDNYVATITKMSDSALFVQDWDLYAGGTAYTQGNSTVGYLRQHGYAMTGAPVASNVQVLQLHASSSPPSAQLTACWDTSKFVMVDQKTKAPVSTPLAHPLVADVSLQENGGYWRVTQFSEPGASC